MVPRADKCKNGSQAFWISLLNYNVTSYLEYITYYLEKNTNFSFEIVSLISTNKVPFL